MPHRRRAALATGALAVVGAVAAVASPAAVAAPRNSPIAAIQDDRLGGPHPGVDPLQRFRQIAALGARLVRVDLLWSQVATTRPANPANPNDPAYDWSWYDRVVDASRATGVPIMFTVFSTPAWAADPSVPATARSGQVTFGPESRRPANAADFGAFARAAATRYAPLGVRLWEAWNEPNIPLFLRPQFVRAHRKWTNVSAGTYAALDRAFYENVKSVDPSAQVGGLVTSPAGDRCPPKCPAGADSRTAPLTFLSLLARPGLRPPMDAVSHHPYPVTGPRPGTPARATYVDLYNLGALEKALSRTYLRRKRIWLTEFGFATQPVANYKKLIVSPARQASLLASAYALVRADPRVRIFSWYFLQDNPDWRSGLYDQNGGPKAANATFKLPFAPIATAVVKGRATQLVGQVRVASTATTVTIQERLRGRFRTLRRLRTTADGSFQLQVRVTKPATYRAVWTSPAGQRLTSVEARVTVERPKPKRRHARHR